MSEMYEEGIFELAGFDEGFTFGALIFKRGPMFAVWGALREESMTGFFKSMVCIFSQSPLDIHLRHSFNSMKNRREIAKRKTHH